MKERNKDAAKAIGSAAVGAGVGAGWYAAAGGVGVAGLGGAIGITLGPFIAIGAGVGLAGYGVYWLGKEVGRAKTPPPDAPMRFKAMTVRSIEPDSDGSYKVEVAYALEDVARKPDEREVTEIVMFPAGTANIDRLTNLKVNEAEVLDWLASRAGARGRSGMPASTWSTECAIKAALGGQIHRYIKPIPRAKRMRSFAGRQNTNTMTSCSKALSTWPAS